MKDVIKKADKALQNANEQHELGADNQYEINYWSAYLDGARAQKREDVANDPIVKIADLTGAFLVATSEYGKQMQLLIDELNYARLDLEASERDAEEH